MGRTEETQRTEIQLSIHEFQCVHKESGTGQLSRPALRRDNEDLGCCEHFFGVDVFLENDNCEPIAITGGVKASQCGI